MVLLDEKIAVVNISKSSGVGDVNLDIMLSFDDEDSIQVFKNAITTAIKKPTNVGQTKPDYDVLVEYEGGFPTHAIHLWLGEENEQSTLMYMVGEGETYVTTGQTTNQLRKLLISE
ncbi:MAG: hypothetical protein GX072_13320 [Lysinibacillus sp.]|nr:hypothetical protein [Lysinibacillus sp.]